MTKPASHFRANSATVSAMVLYAMLSLGRGLASEVCNSLRESSKASLLSYVHEKYNLSETTRIEIAEDSPVAGTCYRRLPESPSRDDIEQPGDRSDGARPIRGRTSSTGQSRVNMVSDSWPEPS
jgi:hypothetical protein